MASKCSCPSRLSFRVCRLVGVKYAHRFDQIMSQFCKNFPRPDMTCVGHRVVKNRLAAQAPMTKMFALSKSLYQELIQATEILNFVLNASSGNHPTEGFEWQIGHHLSQYQLSRMHDHSRQIISANDDLSTKSNSNRGHRENRIYS